MQLAILGHVLELLHRFGAAHIGVAGSHSDEFRKGVVERQLDFMSQRFFHVFEVGGDGEVFFCWVYDYPKNFTMEKR